MSRSRPLPPAPGHDGHALLLVAQLSAGDELDDQQRAEAQRLISSCGACAQLSADLGSLAYAVAREPVPVRRRDFRLEPGQAERLRGNAVTRFLRRLSLPQARAFQPAAAGVLTVGLVFAVAGYAWPDSGSLGGSDALVQPTTEARTSEPPAQGSAPRALATPLREPEPAAAEAAPVPVEPGSPMAADALAADALAAQPTESPAKRAERTMASDRATDTTATDGNGALAQSAPGSASVDDGPADGVEVEAVPEGRLEAFGAEGVDEGQAPESTAVMAVEPDAEGVESTVEQVESTAAEAVPEVEELRSSDDALGPAAAAGSEPLATGPPATESLAAASAADGWDVDIVLIIAGLVMAASGGGALVLAALARRARDPLLR